MRAAASSTVRTLGRSRVAVPREERGKRNAQRTGDPRFERRGAPHASRTGKPCRLNAIIGGTVCHVHGGSALQVKRRAAEGVAELRDSFFDRIAEALGALSPEQLGQLQGNPQGITALVDSAVKLSEHHQLLTGSPTARIEGIPLAVIDAEIARLGAKLGSVPPVA